MFSPILRLLLTYLAVGLVVFGFFNRDRLADMMGWGAEEERVAAAESPPAPVAAPAPATAPAAPVFAPPPGDNGVPDVAAARAPAPAATPAAPALQTPTPPAAASTAGVLQTPMPPAQATQPAAPVASLQTPTPPATPAPAVPAPAAQNAQIQPKDSFETQIGTARAAYWQGDIPTAIAIYGDLLKEYPDSEMLHGELGNIYYMNGNRVEAATHYEAAGMAALKDGNNQQAQMLLGVLGSLDRAAAARLQKALEGNQ